MSLRSSARRSIGFVPFVALALATAPGSSHAESSGSPRLVAEDFAARLGPALVSGATAWDSLWQEGARDSVRRDLDLRTYSLFLWSAPRVRVESARAAGDDVIAELSVLGTAEWESRAWGVAAALWPLQCDENRLVNHVTRREAWRLVPDGGVWKAVERIRLRPVEILAMRVTAQVYPEQNTLLVDATYTMRSRFDGLETMRFLLDRRAQIYRLAVDGQTVEVVRGGELGALGVDGFTPEVESSFRFAEPLAFGQEVSVRFRIRSPTVHLEDEGILTTLPLKPGPFRVRAWMPVFDPAHAAGGAIETVELAQGWDLHWTEGEFVDNAYAPSEGVWKLEPLAVEREGERAVRVTYREIARDPSRDLDFALGRPGVSVPAADWGLRCPTPLPKPDFGVRWDRPDEDAPRPFAWASRAEARPGVTLDPHPRSREALVGPLVDAAGYSTRDLAAELSDLLPVDLDLMDDESGGGDGDAEGGDDAQGER